ncbi:MULTISPECIES: hypothetical protein [unclassified Colwellia]|nr:MULTISPECIES: hypothetical protein [unclassified Colwellia]MBA6257660.1 hypothetical protein [Colwellia sp. MB3u-28]MBA6259417.1 hypothetical protein [Colwellia sp. MB3u-41]
MEFGLRLPSHFIASGSSGPHIPSRRKPIYKLPEKEFIAEIEGINGPLKK